MALSKTEVSKYRKRLEVMRDKILVSLKINTAEVKKPDEATGYSQHHADQGTDDFDRKISIELTTKEFQLLGKIERALEKVADGSYGKCDISGEEIPKVRLEAMPYATTTVKAQEKIEKGLI